MEETAQQVLNALSLGGEYALLALGLAMVFSVMGLVNFAHGEFITITGYAMLGGYYLGIPILLLLPVGVAAAVAAGIVFERVAFRPVRNASPTTGLLTAFGVSIVIQNFFLIFIATRPRAVPTPSWMRQTISIGSLDVQMLQVLEGTVTLVAILLLAWLLRKTTVGIAMRAAATDFNTVRLMGVRANRVIATAFAISGLLAGVTALFIIARRGAVDPFMGFIPVLKAFVATVLGGFGSLTGAVIGGFALGALEVGFQATLPDAWAGFRDAFVFLLVGAVLVLRPQGIFGGHEVEYAG